MEYIRDMKTHPAGIALYNMVILDYMEEHRSRNSTKSAVIQITDEEQ